MKKEEDTIKSIVSEADAHDLLHMTRDANEKFIIEKYLQRYERDYENQIAARWENFFNELKENPKLSSTVLLAIEQCTLKSQNLKAMRGLFLTLRFNTKLRRGFKRNHARIFDDFVQKVWDEMFPPKGLWKWIRKQMKKR